MATFDPNQLQKQVEDSFYVTVGLGLMAFQKIQVARNEFRTQLQEQTAIARKNAEETAQTLQERRQASEQRVEDVLDDIQSRLPEQLQSAMAQFRSAAKEARADVEKRLSPQS